MNSLPTLYLYVGLYADIVLEGPGSPDFLWSAFTESRFVSTGLALTKGTSDATQAEVTAAGANLLVHILGTDLASKTPGNYEYQLEVRPSSPAAAWRDVGGKGEIILRRPA